MEEYFNICTHIIIKIINININIYKFYKKKIKFKIKTSYRVKAANI